MLKQILSMKQIIRMIKRAGWSVYKYMGSLLTILATMYFRLSFGWEESFGKLQLCLYIATPSNLLWRKQSFSFLHFQSARSIYLLIQRGKCPRELW